MWTASWTRAGSPPGSASTGAWRWNGTLAIAALGAGRRGAERLARLAPRPRAGSRDSRRRARRSRRVRGGQLHLRLVEARQDAVIDVERLLLDEEEAPSQPE